MKTHTSNNQIKFKALSVFLKTKRLQAGLTQIEVSRALGYSNSQFLSNCERGLCAPPLCGIRILMKLYKIPTNAMIKLLIDEQRKFLRSKLTSSGGYEKSKKAKVSLRC
jgi:transcriptional regulator with XRE-family HTH domain